MISTKKLIYKILQTRDGKESGADCVYWKLGNYKVALFKWSGSIACTTASTDYNGYRSGAITFTIPSGIFSSTPLYAFISKNSSGAVMPRQIEPNSNKTFKCYFFSGASATETVSISALLIGK